MQRDKFIIRDGQIDDCAGLTGIATRSKAHWGYDQKFMENCREELEVTPEGISTDKVRVALTVGKPIAFSQLTALEEAGAFEVEAMFVDPPYIGSGIGKLLWNDLLEILQHENASRLIVQSDPFAVGFYVAMGMQHIGLKESESIPGRMLPMLELTF